ncbi:hypothetical protein TWF481_009482 [Arthrobotrys musiformis]|uniref:Uncharacterized protein n=1 Tax=Arthrobotrys musiformis TaxID=47236 RepID=A0AAV9W3S5_9PEZI
MSTTTNPPVQGSRKKKNKKITLQLDHGFVRDDPLLISKQKAYEAILKSEKYWSRSQSPPGWSEKSPEAPEAPKVRAYRVPDLKSFAIAIQSEGFTESMFITLEDPSRMTGIDFLIKMARTSLAIENMCQSLQNDPNTVLTHSITLHEVMQQMKSGWFQPYFLSKEELDKTDELRRKLIYYGKIINKTSKTLNLVRENIDGSETEPKVRFIELKVEDLDGRHIRFIPNQDRCLEYFEQFDRVRAQLREFRDDLNLRTQYLRDERRATVRLLTACRRLKAILKDRVSEEMPCKCRLDYWELDVWRKFGLPVMGVPAISGPRGFAPI